MAVALAGRGDRAAMQFDQLLHDRQAQAQAAMASGGGAIGLAEAAEQMIEEFGRDAITGIAHGDLPVVAVGPQLQVECGLQPG
uniref:Uncharacterized protein n=1 Tax=Panagrolaimus superbus TaxID=310955 RepID=A0A914Y1U5_9BILA